MRPISASHPQLEGDEPRAATSRSIIYDVSDAPIPIRGRSPGVGWRRLTHGIHVPNDGLPGGDLAGWQLLLPARGCFTHLTAAAHRGWWLPPLPDELPVFVCMTQSDPRPLRAGIRSIRLAHAVPLDTIQGIRTATPFEVLLACARDLCVVDLVVLLDGALFVGDVHLEELARLVASTCHRRGLALLRTALALADPRSESPWETLLRLLLVLCGVHVHPQYEVPGTFGALGRADLWVVGTRTLQEFDGEVHLERAQHKRDLRRLRRLDREQWTRHGYTADDVLHRAVGILRDADDAIGREHRPERVRVWHDMLRESLFTPAGRARLVRRLEMRRSA
jgi:hypothetical protein